jgi:hypothetical protein
MHQAHPTAWLGYESMILPTGVACMSVPVPAAPSFFIEPLCVTSICNLCKGWATQNHHTPGS